MIILLCMVPFLVLSLRKLRKELVLSASKVTLRVRVALRMVETFVVLAAVEWVAIAAPTALPLLKHITVFDLIVLSALSWVG